MTVIIVSGWLLSRPSGSNDVYYVDSGTDEMSAAVSETTVESNHTGINVLLFMNTWQLLVTVVAVLFVHRGSEW